MPSPFPGMDPYLEDDKLWPTFQHQLVHCLYQILLPGLMDRYRARIAQRHYVNEQALFTSVVRDEHHEQLIEIRQRSDGKLITLIDVASPAVLPVICSIDAASSFTDDASSSPDTLTDSACCAVCTSDAVSSVVDVIAASIADACDSPFCEITV